MPMNRIWSAPFNTHALLEDGATTEASRLVEFEQGYAGLLGIDATPAAQGVSLVPSAGNAPFEIPVDSIVIQWPELQFLAVSVIGPVSTEPAVI